MRELLAVEQEFGRKRIIHWGPRTLDLDILYGENTTCHSELLTLPHPWFWDRLLCWSRWRKSHRILCIKGSGFRTVFMNWGIPVP